MRERWSTERPFNELALRIISGVALRLQRARRGHHSRKFDIPLGWNWVRSRGKQRSLLSVVRTILVGEQRNSQAPASEFYASLHVPIFVC
ncbi:hypothetical protein J6590_067582 [Homalodisca vitripennis]|nr:hypothetical protein J6590_067582 [Homalodisca vitripennis]